MITGFIASYPYLSGALKSIFHNKQQNNEITLDEDDFINLYIKSHSHTEMQHLNDQLAKIWHSCNSYFANFNIDIGEHDYWSSTKETLFLNVRSSIFDNCIVDDNDTLINSIAEKWQNEWEYQLLKDKALISIKLDDLFSANLTDIEYENRQLLNVLDFLNLYKNQNLISEGEQKWRNTVNSIDIQDIQVNCSLALDKLILSSLQLHFNLTKALGGLSNNNNGINDFEWLLNAYNPESNYLSKISYTCRPYNQLYLLLFAKTLLDKKIANFKSVHKPQDGQFIIELSIPTDKWIHFYNQNQSVKNNLIKSNTSLDITIYIHQNLNFVKNSNIDIDVDYKNFCSPEGLVWGFSNQYQSTQFNVNNFWSIIRHLFINNAEPFDVRKSLFETKNSSITNLKISDDFINKAIGDMVESSILHLTQITKKWELENKNSDIIKNGCIVKNNTSEQELIGKWQFKLENLESFLSIPHFENFKKYEYPIYLLTNDDWEKLKNNNDVSVKSDLTMFISNISKINHDFIVGDKVKNLDLIFVEFEIENQNEVKDWSDSQIEMLKQQIRTDNCNGFFRIYGMEEQWGKIPPHLLLELV